MGKTKTKSRSVGDSPKPPITIRSTNPKILDDNIAKLEKAIQAGDVSANPSGTAEETLLSTIGIDGKKYELGPSAENTSYNNTDSGLTATDVQAAIDEVSSASGISYDNTDSGLTADDVQAVIDELNANNTWKVGGSETGATSIDLPATFNELTILIHQTNDYSLCYSLSIIKNELSSSDRIFRSGYYISDSNNGCVYVNVSNSRVLLGNYFINGTSYLTDTVTEVYYK